MCGSVLGCHIVVMSRYQVPSALHATSRKAAWGDDIPEGNWKTGKMFSDVFDVRLKTDKKYLGKLGNIVLRSFFGSAVFLAK